MKFEKRICLFLVLLVSLLVPQVPNIQAQDGGDLPIFEAADCPFSLPADETDVECGYLIVPENRSLPDSPTIELAVAIIYSPNPSPEPIIYLEGGPGGSALSAVDSWLTSILRENHDLILLDQRGTGYSSPTLDCPEINEDYESEDAATEACRDRLLADGVDLTAYNSAESAADVNDLRLALGYEQVILYGISYGTRLALTVMRDFPEGLHSVVIDGVYPPNVNSRETEVLDGYRALIVLFDTCAADADCGSAFPNLEDNFYATIEDLNANPAAVTDPESGEEFDLTGDDLLSAVTQALYDSTLIPALPAALDAAAQGDFETYYDLITFGPVPDEGGDDTESDFGEAEAEEEAYYLLEEGLSDEEYTELEALLTDGEWQPVYDFLADLFDYAPEELELITDAVFNLYFGDAGGETGDEGAAIENDGDSEGMYNSVECREELPFSSLDAAYNLLTEENVPEAVAGSIVGVEAQFTTCELWGAGVADPIENEAVVSDIPTLVLSGNFDPVTPPSSGELAAETLSQSYVYTFPSTGHGALETFDCPNSIIMSFLADPLTEPDASCIQAMTVEFYIP